MYKFLLLVAILPAIIVADRVAVTPCKCTTTYMNLYVILHDALNIVPSAERLYSYMQAVVVVHSRPKFALTVARPNHAPYAKDPPLKCKWIGMWPVVRQHWSQKWWPPLWVQPFRTFCRQTCKTHAIIWLTLTVHWMLANGQRTISNFMSPTFIHRFVLPLSCRWLINVTRARHVSISIWMLLVRRNKIVVMSGNYVTYII